MAVHKDEHRDVYIAAIIGGIVLLLLLLYVWGASVPASAATPGNEPILPDSVGGVPGLGGDAYNYNIPAYNGGAPVGNTGNTYFGLPANSNNNCCDACGPGGTSPVNVAPWLFSNLLQAGGG